MRAHPKARIAARDLTALLLVLALLGLSPLALAQDDSPSRDPVMLALDIARDIVEAERDKPLKLVRWRYYEDDWSHVGSHSQYGSFGIDNCVDAVPVAQKRSDILFGWTISLLDRSGKEYQARVTYDLQESVLCDETQVPARYGGAARQAQEAAQAAETGDAGDTPAPVASTANVSGFNLGGHVAGFDGGTAKVMQSARMTWVKKQVRHGISDGAGIIGAAKAQGFKVLLGALGQKNKLANNFDAYIDEYAKYVALLASQGAHAIEVWNEPNIQHEWPVGQINGANYTKLLAKAFNAIKAANPNTIVISGAPAPSGFSQTGCQADLCNDDVFVQQMAAAGAANYMDCVGVHYNAGAVPPNATSGAPVGSSGHYSWYLPSMMRVYRNAFPTKPLCFTELGYLTGEGIGDLPGHFAWAAGNSLAEQAQWLAGAVNVARGSGYVNMIIVWNVNFTAWGNDPQYGYAIVRPGGGCPACDSLRGAMGG